MFQRLPHAIRRRTCTQLTPTHPLLHPLQHSHSTHYATRTSSTSTQTVLTHPTTETTSNSPSTNTTPCPYPCPVCICTSPPSQPPTNDQYLRMILTAKVYDVAMESPLQLARSLSRRSNHRIYLKREDLQTVFSFKLRGAYNKMAHLTQEQKQKGVLTCSAGNHAQGVALASARMGVSASIVMPVFTPAIKVNAVKNLGGHVILHGNDFDQAQRECIRLSKEDGRLIIHPYDDPYVIAGQGTIGLEILRQYHPLQNQNKPIHAIFVPVGGGGIIAGIALYVKQLHPSVLVIGVETDDADSMCQSLEQNERVELKEVGLFADGAAVRLVGKETFRICQSLVDGMIRVKNDELCAAIKDTFEDTRSILEPAGALSVAGCKKFIEQHPELKNESFVCITSGANMNFNRLRFVAERAELGEKKEALLSVAIPETPGSFMRLYSTIFPRSVTEFSYRYNDPDRALIYIAFEVKDRSEVSHVMQQLHQHGMQALDISDNEMAKNHTRYLAGGRSLRVRHERVYRFEFPERPGALMRFLQCLNRGDEGTQPPWNVTLFHYRNYGSDFGKVLCGIEVPPHQQQQFETFLKTLGYSYHDETENPVYKQFLL